MEPESEQATLIRRQRQHRDQRCPKAAPISLRERDRWILDALGKMRFLTTTLLAGLFFAGSRTAANKRLRRLYDAGLIRIWVRGLPLDNVYALTPGGRDALNDTVDAAAPMPSCPRRLDGQLDHLLAINAVRIAFAVSQTDAVLAWWQSDWDLRAFASHETVPDARFALRWPNGEEHTFALEVEYQTRTPRKFLTKMLRYVGSRSGPLSGFATDTILVVGQHPAWLDRYRSASALLSLSHCVWFTTLAELELHGAAGPIWHTVGDDSSVSLTDLTNRPYGSATSRAENVAAARSSTRTAAQTYPKEPPNNCT